MAMAVSYEDRIVHEPSSVPGLLSTDKPSWFSPHDEAPLGYWRKPDGYIILSQYGENGTEKKLDRGFERLGSKYGSYASAGTRTWHPSQDPLYPLVAKGGIVEMPAKQIRELGWHRPPDRAAKASHRTLEAQIQRVMQERVLPREEALLVVAPQLRGVDLTDYSCAACPGRWFPSEAAMLAHESVVHRDAVQSRSIGNAVAAAQAGQSGAADQTALLQIIAQQGELIAEMKARLDDLTATKGGAKK